MDKRKIEVIREEGDRVVLRFANDAIRSMMYPAERKEKCGSGSVMTSDELLEALENCLPPEEDTPMPGEPGFHWGL